MIKHNISKSKLFVSCLLVLFSFIFLTQVSQYIPIPYLGFFSLIFFGLIAFILTFGVNFTKQLFAVPKKFSSTVSIYLPVCLIIGFITALVLKLIFPDLKGNSESNNPLWFYFIIMPFALMGEEVFSIFWLEVAKLKYSSLIASLISAVIFGLIHFSTYYDGNVVTTLIHILLLQSVSRIFFNMAYERSESIWTSFIIHYLMDLVLFTFPLLIK